MEDFYAEQITATWQVVPTTLILFGWERASRMAVRGNPYTAYRRGFPASVVSTTKKQLYNYDSFSYQESRGHTPGNGRYSSKTNN